jgi:hypothetical protein
MHVPMGTSAAWASAALSAAHAGRAIYTLEIESSPPVHHTFVLFL